MCYVKLFIRCVHFYFDLFVINGRWRKEGEEGVGGGRGEKGRRREEEANFRINL